MRSPEPVRAARRANDGPLRVLLVEDDPTDLRLIARALGAGHDPHLLLLRAGTLGEALDTLAVSQISLVLLDLNLPESRGLDTLVRLRRDAPWTPIVVLTGEDTTELGSQCIAAGAQDFLPKCELVASVLWRSIDFALSRVRRSEARADQHLRGVIRSLIGQTGEFGQTGNGDAERWLDDAPDRKLALISQIHRLRSTYVGALHQLSLGQARTELQQLAADLAQTRAPAVQVIREALQVREEGPAFATIDISLYALELIGALCHIYREQLEQEGDSSRTAVPRGGHR